MTGVRPAGPISYDNVLFREAGAAQSASARYHQRGDLVWAEFGGGRVQRGSLVGSCAEDGELELAYCMVLADGEVVSGRTLSSPRLLPDGRIQLIERWERFGPRAARGVSHLEQVWEPTQDVR